MTGGAVKRLAVIAAALVIPILACSSYESASDAPSDAGAEGGSGKGKIEQDGLTIVPAELMVPAVRCGETSTGAITLINNGDVDQPYEATLFSSDVFTIKSGATGTVKAHDTATIIIDAKGEKPETAAVAVAIKTKSAVGSVSVKAEVKGAMLTITPHKADFGFVKENQVSAPINAIFANSGSTSIAISGFEGGAEKSNFTFPATIVVPANGSITSPITMTAGPASVAIAAVVTPILVDPTVLCGPAESLLVTGQRVSDDVIVSPASADFGAVDCKGTSATKATVTISNFSVDKSGAFTATLPPDTHFSVTPASGNIATASGATASKVDLTIGVLNAGDTPGNLTETMDVSIAGGKTYKIALTMSVLGAVLQITPTSLLNIPNGGLKSFTVKNVGNTGVCIQASSDNPAFMPSDNGPFPIQPAGTGKVDVQFAGSGTPSGTISIKSSGGVCFGGTAILCKPVPTVAVSGGGG